jgi:hypothetical protein
MFIFLGDFGCRKSIPTPPPISQPKTKTMEPHVVRLLIEQEQLEEKLSKLEAVFQSTLFDSFEENMKSLLLIQFHAMKTYRECLEQRIKILK